MTQSLDKTTQKNAVILLSGGIDSATTAAIALDQGFDLTALTFAYGQRHAVELAAAHRVAQALGIDQHIVQTIDLRAFGGSALTADIDVPKHRDTDQTTHNTKVPVTYVPARNTIFLAHALAAAETSHAFDIFIGANAVDYSGYPDCRPRFIQAFEQLANLATAATLTGPHRFRIHAPLIQMTKAQIIKLGHNLGIDYGLTHSCYDPDESGAACAACDSCLIRKTGFNQANLTDPTRYQDSRT